MELSNPLKMIPSKFYLPLALLGGGLIAWRFLSGSSKPEESPQNSSMGYDPSLVALGVQTSLERDKLNAQTELGKLAMQTELEALNVQTQADLVKNDRETSLANQMHDRETSSTERMYGGDLTLRNIELSVMQNLGLDQGNTDRFTAQQSTYGLIESARITGDAQVKAAKASKKKSIGFGGFSLGF